MQLHFAKMVKLAVESDSTVTPVERNLFLKLTRGEITSSPVQNGNGHAPRIYSRAEAAKLLGDKTPRYVDMLCKRGLLQKFIPSGNQRGIGITSNSFNQFLGSGA